MFPSLGQPNVRITPDRALCGRYGLNVGDVEAVVQAAIGGQAVTQVYEGEKRFDLTVRWGPPSGSDLQRDPQHPGGHARRQRRCRSGRSPQIVEEEGPSLIYREDNRRYTPVKFSVRGRDLASHHRRGAAEDRREGQAALRHAPRVGRARSTSSTRPPGACR